jgi:hypothetical protein
MARDTGQCRCRLCGFERWRSVTVKRKNCAIYTTSFSACSDCSITMLNPEQFNALTNAASRSEDFGCVDFRLDGCARICRAVASLRWHRPEFLRKDARYSDRLKFVGVHNPYRACAEVRGVEST